MVGIRSGKEINPDVTTFYYESNNRMESLLKNFRNNLHLFSVKTPYWSLVEL